MATAISVRAAEEKLILLYDGVCALCNRWVRFLLRRDRHDRLRFAPLQSRFAADVLQRHGHDAADLDTAYLIIDYGKPTELVLSRARALLYAAEACGGLLSFCRVFRVIPQPLLDFVYDRVAHSRYRTFGKYDTCPRPEPQHAAKFIAGDAD